MEKSRTSTLKSVLAGCLAVSALASIAGCASASRVRSDHYDGHRFHNPDHGGEHGFFDFVKLLWTHKYSKWPKHVPNSPQPPPPGAVEGDEMSVTFVSHATFILQVKGWNILTDPVYSKRASPVSWAGPARVREPGVTFEDLPRIDIVLISHNHYDHMDLATLKKLQATYRPIFITSLGNKKFLESEGLERVQEMDWWQEQAFDNGQSRVTVTFTPAQHFAARGLFDRNRTLWGGFMINTDAGQIFFAGDTGYADHFKKIRERLGPPDLTLMPIGAYEPRWFMRSVHLTPEDAVQAHLDLESKLTLGMHFGTFQLTDEPIDEPPRLLLKDMETRGLEPSTFRVLDFGQTLLIDRRP